MSILKSIVKKDKNSRPQPRREPEPSCFPQVVRKLRNIPPYAECSNQDVNELVADLINPEKLIQYFDLTPELEDQGAAVGGPEDDVLPVQLVFKSWHQHNGDVDLESILLDEYGPVHAYLVVGNLILEWDWSSLIIPHGKPISEAAEAEVVQDVQEARCNPMKVMLLEKKVLAKVAKYNKMYYFHVIRRNSHDFVRCVLELLSYPPPQQLENKLKKYFDCLENSKSGCVPIEFDTHSDLDQYVIEHMKNFSEIDKEYIIVHYFMFHFVSRLRAEKMSMWKCPEPYCRMHALTTTIDLKQMKINNFRTIKYNFHGSTSEDDLSAGETSPLYSVPKKRQPW